MGQLLQSVATCSSDNTAGGALSLELLNGLICKPGFWERFWGRVDQSGACWLWQGSKNLYGYGQLRIGPRGFKKRLLAHRVAYVSAGHVIADGKDLLHSCDTPSCVRPEHLREGTQVDNMVDAKARGRMRRGERHRNAKLTEAAVLEIRRLAAEGHRRVDIGERFGVSGGAVSGVVSGKRWGHVVGGSGATHETYPGHVADNKVVVDEEYKKTAAIGVLRKARELIARGWCRGEMCADEHGRSAFRSGTPVAWSLYGAIATVGNAGIEAEWARRLVRKQIGQLNIPDWNDNPVRTQKEVLCLIDAICGPARRGGWAIGGIS